MGQTRFEQAHLVAQDGSLSSISLCKVLNARTHPELRERALAGNLHRLDDGRELAVSFVYHDPLTRKFALVLPSVLAHTELTEWARLMEEIAADTRHPVPLYVRDNTTVIGRLAFERYVNAEVAFEDESEDAGTVLPGEPGADVTQREKVLRERERELAEQERALIRMAEALTAREGELLRTSEQLETARVDLELREQDLQERARPPELRPAAQNSWMQVGVVTDSLPASGDGLAAASGPEKGFAVRSHPPPLPALRPHPHTPGPPPLPLRQRSHVPPLSAARAHAAAAALDGARESAEEPTPHGSSPPPLPHHHAPALTLAKSNPDAEPEVAPPAYFAGQRVGQMAVKLLADELWLFVHIDEARAAEFRRSVDLFLQYVEVEGYPVLLLSLLGEAPDGQPIRLALDGHSDADLRVLEHLSRSFRARVALYIGGVYLETLTVAALREGVAQAVSDALSQLPAARPALAAADAMLRVQHAPPPLTNDDLPFGPARREASTTATVLASVEQLASWLRPEKLAEAALTYCTPRNVIDATIRRVLRAAVAFGIALPDALLPLAIEHRAARDVPGLIRAQLQSFRQRVERGDNDLGSVATRRNWERLLAQAEAHELAVDDATRALASAQSARPGPRSDATRALRLFEGLSPAELLARLSDPQERLPALRELCVRGSGLPAVLEALPQLSPEELPQGVACLVAYGEQAGDGLIAALSAPDPALRQLAALALGRLKLRRALLPLLKQLESEEGEAQPELARAIGDFGSAALRALSQAIASSDHPDRFIGALAHVANHGGAREVERLENSTEPPVAYAARKAMARRSRMEWEDLAVREQRTLGEGETAALLSQAFYAALTKVAI